MGKYSELLEQIMREDGGGAAGGGATSGGGTAMTTAAVGPTTAQDGNTSISYIPGGFKKRKMPQLGLEPADEELELKEQRSELIHNLYNKLMRVMTVDLRDNKQIKRTIVLLNYWLSLFPQSKYLPMSSQVAVNLGVYDRSIRELIDRIKNIYTDDIGNLEILINTIRQDMPLSSLEPFAEFDYIVGVRVQTNYDGIVMILELTVNLAMVPTQSIYIESGELLDELGSYRTIKVLKDMVFPVGQMFVPSIFHNIKQMADEITEEPKKNKEEEEENE
jgi:hypothetical protein